MRPGTDQSIHQSINAMVSRSHRASVFCRKRNRAAADRKRSIEYSFPNSSHPFCPDPPLSGTIAQMTERSPMNRREFSILLSMLAAAPAAIPAGAEPAHTPLAMLASGRYPEGPATHPSTPGRTSRHIVIGMLPDNIRFEAHVTTLAPGAPPEAIAHHKHTEIWLVREGQVTLMTDGVTRTLQAGDMGICIAGDNHYVANASQSAPCSYFVITVGPPE